jgi:hypothetical protein
MHVSHEDINLGIGLSTARVHKLVSYRLSADLKEISLALLLLSVVFSFVLTSPFKRSSTNASFYVLPLTVF